MINGRYNKAKVRFKVAEIFIQHSDVRYTTGGLHVLNLECEGKLSERGLPL